MIKVGYLEQENQIVLVQRLNDLYTLLSYDGISWYFIGNPNDWKELTYIGEL